MLGEQGIPIRATISDMGPLLLGRLLNLNETQNGVLNIVFKVADQQGLLLLDLKDLQAMLQHVGENAKEYSTAYGNVSPASIGAIQRGLLALSEQGAEKFFGEPALSIDDLLHVDASGRGTVNILAADRLMSTPKVYATFLLWLLADLFEKLPEVGDIDKPKLVFFFDEAHLLFDEAPKIVLEKIEQVVRLIRSKGVGVFFVSQNPLDIPDTVLGQLGNRVQHALRAFTPEGSKSGPGRRPDVSQRRLGERRTGDLAACRRRSALFVSRRSRFSAAGRSWPDRSAAQPLGSHHRRGSAAIRPAITAVWPL